MNSVTQKKRPRRRLDLMITVRMNEQDYLDLLTRAKQTGTSQASTARMLILEGLRSAPAMKEAGQVHRGDQQ